MARILGERLGAPVHLLNDVRAATLGGFTLGAGRGTSTMALFALGTGVGDVLFDGVRRELAERVRVFPIDDVRVEPAVLGTDAGLAGVLVWTASRSDWL